MDHERVADVYKAMKKTPWEKAQAAFAHTIEAVLRDVGATLSESPYGSRWTLETKAGKLEISVSPSSLGPGGCVNCRFQDVDRACLHFGLEPGAPRPSWTPLNTYSGKWNHVYIGATPEYAAHALRGALGKVL